MTNKRKWNYWRTAWVALLVAFMVIEIPAILNSENDDTFSEFIWDFVVVNWVGWVVVAGLLGWLAYHFLIQKDKS